MSWHAVSVCIISIVVTVQTASTTGKCQSSMSVEMPNALVMSNGSVWDPDEGLEYPPDTFWIEDGMTHGCPCMLDRPCMRKCCGKDQAMHFHTLECIPHNESVPWFRPNLTIDEMGDTRVARVGEFGILHGNYCLGYLLEPLIYPEDAYVLNFDNGSLVLQKNPESWLGPKDFCVEYFPEEDSYLPYVCFRGSKESSDSETCNQLRFVLYPIGMIISIVFLIAALAVYAIEPKLRNLCGKCMVFYMSSLLCSYVSLSTVQALGGLLSDRACMVFGFIIYFSLLCTFFWLNVLCIDITLAFRSPQAILGNPVARDRKKLTLYSLYAWGMPLLITMVAIVSELHPGVPDTILKPKFHLTCWFYENESRLLYFICPVGVLILCNLCLFIFTARCIYVINKKNMECKHKKDKRRCTKMDKKRLRIYAKLYVVMGVTWILEILSFVIGGSKCIWLFTDMINTLQGLFIFIILICNRKVLGMLRSRLCRRMVTAEDPVTRMDESGTSSEEDDRDLQTSSTSTDAATKKNEFRLKNKECGDGVAEACGDPQESTTGDK